MEVCTSVMAAASTHRCIVFVRGCGYPARHVRAHLDPLLHIGGTPTVLGALVPYLQDGTPNAERGRGIGHLPPREWPECARQSCGCLACLPGAHAGSHRGGQPSKTSDLSGPPPRPPTVLNESGGHTGTYGSALGTAGAAPYRREKWLWYRPWFTSTEVVYGVTGTEVTVLPECGVVIGQRARGRCSAGMWLIQERPPGAVVRAWCPKRSEEDVLWVRVAATARHGGTASGTPGGSGCAGCCRAMAR